MWYFAPSFIQSLKFKFFASYKFENHVTKTTQYSSKKNSLKDLTFLVQIMQKIGFVYYQNKLKKNLQREKKNAEWINKHNVKVKGKNKNTGDLFRHF